MRTSFTCRTALIAIVLFIGCRNASSIVPTAATPATTVTPPTSPPSPGLAQGDIALASVTHPSGSTLALHDCGPSRSGIAGNHVCTEEWRGAFDVVVDRDIARVAITVTFEGRAGRCGEVYVPDSSFAAGRARLVSTSNPLYLTYEPEGYDNVAVVQRCALPTTTQRLVVQLWDRDSGPGSSAVPILREEFDYVSIFIKR